MDIAKIAFLEGLSPEEISKVRDITVERVYPKGTMVFSEGQESDGLFLIISGLIKVSKISKNGREKILAILGEGEIVGEMTVFGCHLRSATLHTLEATIVLVIKREDFRKILREIRDLAPRVVELLSNRLRYANRQIEELVFLNSRSRVICTLILLAQEGKLTLRLTHAELANLIGVSRETVTKVIAELKDCGLIQVARKEITIMDIERLYREVI